MSTAIQWTDETWNPIAAFDKATGKRGWFCTHASPGCLHCYAEQMNTWRGNGHKYRVPNLDKVEIRIAERVLAQPLSWRQPKKIFVCSMTDLFHEAHPDALIDHVFAVMAKAQRHTFQVLTKRAKRMRDYTNARLLGLPLPNVWLGVSVENQQYANERIPILLDTPAAIRWLSCEPLLGPMQIPEYLPNKLWNDLPSWRQPEIDWVVIGGESGKHARPFDLRWARELVAQCRVAGVAPFVKQLGAYPVDEWPRPINLKHSHGGVMDEWPADLRVREFPTPAVHA